MSLKNLGIMIGITILHMNAIDEKPSRNALPPSNRTSLCGVHPLILNRWSPRAMSGAPISHKELMALFEAAHLAPSSYNGQFWRFIYAHRDTREWQTLFDLLVPFNQEWVQNGAALIVVISYNKLHEHPARTHSFDTGAACQNLLLQATSMGLVTHVMEGFDYDQARKDLEVPEDYTIEAMIAVGHPGSTQHLSQDLRTMEVPSGRKPLHELVFQGTFGTSISPLLP